MATARTVDPDGGILDSWALHLRAEKSPGTVTLYLDILGRFSAFLAEQDRSDGLLGASRGDVEAWLGAMRERGLSDHTIRSRWIALRSFYRWAIEEDEIAESPAAKVKIAKPDTPPVTVLSTDELRALLKVCAGTGFKDRRDTAIIRIMANTGLRLQETADLTAADIDLHARIVRVQRGKGGKSRAVRIDPETARAIDRYNRIRPRHRLAGTDGFWIGHRGKFGRKGIYGMLRARGVEAGIGEIHPHQLRHTYAHRYLSKGGNEGDLQRLGGWDSAEVMRRYGSQLADERALEAADDVNVMGEI